MKQKRWRLPLLAIALSLCLIGTLCASLIQSSFGKVTVTEMTLPAPGGLHVSGLLFRPALATADNPLPLIVTSHGSFNNKEMQDQNFVELSRRGFVVFAPDAFRHGSSSINNEYIDSDQALIVSVEALYDLPYIDKTKIAVTGHSMGGGHANVTVEHYITQEALGLGPNKISAALNVGADAAYAPYEIEGIAEPVPMAIDYGIIAAKYDEWFFKSPDVQNNPARYLQGDTARAFVNQVGAGVTGNVENGKVYTGTMDGKTCKRVIYQNTEIHPQNHFSRKSSASMTNFFYEVFGVPNGYQQIPANNQVWVWKELFNLIALIGLFLFILPFGSLLLDLPWFRELRCAAPTPKAAALSTPKSKLVFWCVYGINLVLPALLLMPVGYHLIGKEALVPYTVTAVFGEGNTNELVGWSVAVGLAILAVLLLSHHLFSKKNGGTLASWGYQISAVQFGKTAVVALLIITGLYLLVFAAKFFFLTDFRIWMIAVKTFSLDKLLYAVVYFPGFLLFYLVNSIAVNGCNRVEGWKDWQITLISWIGNIAGIAALIFIQYSVLIGSGNFVFNSMRIVNLFPLIVLIPVATLIGRRFFDKTGNIYLGAFVMAAFYSLMTCANTMFSASIL